VDRGTNRKWFIARSADGDRFASVLSGDAVLRADLGAFGDSPLSDRGIVPEDMTAVADVERGGAPAGRNNGEVKPAKVEPGEDEFLETFNYFNYLTEVEDEFVRRRGSHLTISPMDWALVESWKDAGIPLHIVMRGISKAFDGHDARANTFRKVNSILYCQQAVEESYAGYRLSQVGAAQPGSDESASGQQTEPPKKGKSRKQTPGFAKEAVIEFLDRCHAQLQHAASAAEMDPPRTTEPAEDTKGFADQLADALLRATGRLSDIKQALEQSADVDAQSLERDLEALDRMLLEGLRIAYGEERIKEFVSEAETQLRKYRKKMEKAMYQQTADNFVTRRMREAARIPRLSLFYMT
jgi:hypothetical protein